MLSWDLAPVQFDCGWGVNCVGEAGIIQAREIIAAHISSPSHVSAERGGKGRQRCEYVSSYGAYIVIVAVYVCGNIVTVCICTLALNRGRPLHSYNNEDVLV